MKFHISDRPKQMNKPLARTSLPRWKLGKPVEKYGFVRISPFKTHFLIIEIIEFFELSGPWNPTMHAYVLSCEDLSFIRIKIIAIPYLQTSGMWENT